MQKPVKRPFRNFINTIHLWLGIASGIILFTICLTGTLYAFRNELERWLDKDKYYVKPIAGAQPLPVDSLIAVTEKQTGGKAVSLSIFEDRERAYIVSIRKGEGGPKGEIEPGMKKSRKEEASGSEKAGAGRAKTKEVEHKGGEGSKARACFVNPYTGGITGEDGDSGASRFFATVLRLHRWLLLDKGIGSIIGGVAVLIFVVMIITGLVLWAPARWKNWKQGIRIKMSGNWKRTNHDLHNALGFYAGLFLLTMALTGLNWSFAWYKDGMSRILGAKVFGERGKTEQVKITSGIKPSMAALLLTADSVFSYQGDIRITLPAGPATAVVVNKAKNGFFAVPAPDKLQLDPYSGAVLKTERFGDKPLAEKIAGSMKQIHTGEIFGTFSKIIYLLAALIGASLPVTGTIIWINKLKKRKSRENSRQRAIVKEQEEIEKAEMSEI